jgi:threonine/homoserine/homoserine lactone efflux protein
LINNLANPKMAAFFLSLLPQFAAPGSAMAFLGYGTMFCLMTFGWLTVYAVLLDRMRRYLMRRQVRRALEAISGVVLIAFGIRVASQP